MRKLSHRTSGVQVKIRRLLMNKGHDCTNIEITSDGLTHLRHNEITYFFDRRYVSVPEAMLRLR